MLRKGAEGTATTVGALSIASEPAFGVVFRWGDLELCGEHDGQLSFTWHLGFCTGSFPSYPYF